MLEFSDHALQEVLDVLRKHSDRMRSNQEDLTIELADTTASLDDGTYLFESLIASVRRRHNSQLPIYRFPREILSIIFQIVQDSESWRSSKLGYFAIKQLAAVSFHWCSIVLTTPRLWSIVDTACQSPSLDSIIRRSKGALLDILLRESEILAPKDIMELIIPHVERWRVVEVESLKFVPFFRQIGDAQLLPQLERLRILVWDKGEEVPDFIRSRAPKLHTLHIEPCTFPLGAPVLTTVRTLHFTPEIEGFELWPHQWQVLLSSCPQLEAIRVNGTAEMKRRDVLFPLFHALIPNLQMVSLVKLPVLTIGALISSISVAPGVYPRIALEARSSENRNESVKDLFPGPPQSQTLRWLMRLTKNLSGTCLHRTWNLSITADGDPDGISVSITVKDSQHCPASTALEEIVSLGHITNLESLSLQGPPLFQASNTGRLLSRLPKLKKLDIISPNRYSGHPEYHDNLGDVCEALSLPFTTDSGSRTKWLLPELNDLQIVSLDGFNRVVSLVEGRYGLIESSHGKELPVPLKVLRVRYPVYARYSRRKPMGTVQANRLHEILDGGDTKVEITVKLALEEVVA